MIGAIETALSGLAAASKKVDASASNIANINSAGSLEGDNAPYSAQTTVQETVTDGQGNVTGVKAQNVPKSTPFVPAYDPNSPFANSDGLIGVPNVDLAEEAVNLTMAKIAYKANVATIQTAKDMQDDLLKAFDKKV